MSTDLQARAEYATAQFENTAASEPNKRISVTASFKTPQNIADVVELARRGGFEIEGFRHGDDNHSGGYTLRSGESVDDAIGQYQSDHLLFTQRDLKYTEQMLRDESDEQLRRALERRRSSLQTRLASMADTQLAIIGIDLQGIAADLASFRQSNDFVAVMEIRSGNRRTAVPRPSPVPASVDK